jgi:hypothetical protein
MVTITPEEYAYIRNCLSDYEGAERQEREEHLKKELNTLLELAKKACILLDIDKLHRSIIVDDNDTWNDWANTYIRELQETRK